MSMSVDFVKDEPQAYPAARVAGSSSRVARDEKSNGCAVVARTILLHCRPYARRIAERPTRGVQVASGGRTL